MSRITAPEPKVILSSRYPNPQDLLGRPQFTQHREGWLECNLGRQTGEALFVALWAVGHPASSCLSLSMALQQQGLKGTWNSPAILGPLFPFSSHTPAAELFSITAPWALYRESFNFHVNLRWSQAVLLFRHMEWFHVQPRHTPKHSQIPEGL